MRKIFIFSAVLTGILCAAGGSNVKSNLNGVAPLSRDEILMKYANVKPGLWGEDLDGIVRRLPVATPEARNSNLNDENAPKIVALTFDLCGSAHDGFDEKLVEFLEKEGVKATFFVNARWIKKYPREFARLASNPLFEIENHGARHVPASLTGRSVYGIKGTASAAELLAEIEEGAAAIEAASGRKPRFFRSGTAYYDEGAVALIREAGFVPVGFAVLGDAGATYSAGRVKAAFLSAKHGDIVIAHANHPEKETAEGVIAALPKMLGLGYRFVRLDDYLK